MKPLCFILKYKWIVFREVRYHLKFSMLKVGPYLHLECRLLLCNKRMGQKGFQVFTKNLYKFISWLSLPYNKQIIAPRQLYEWAADNISTMTFTYCTKDNYRHQEIFLHEWFQQSRTIPGTQKLHGFIFLMQNKLHTKVFSNSSTFEFKEERITVS